MSLKVRIEGTAPKRATKGSAGYDLCSSKDVTVWAGSKATVPLGIKAAIPEGYFGLIASRSGLAKKHGVVLLNQPGIVDSDYRGEWLAVLYNTGSLFLEIKEGDRVAQLVVVKCEEVEWESGPLDNTSRGEGGWGSTGR